VASRGEVLPGSEESGHPFRCWICGSDDSSRWKRRSVDRELTPDDLQITDAHYGSTLGLRRCNACSFIFADGDDLRRLTALYERLSDPTYLEGQESRAFQMRWLLGEVLRTKPNAGTLLDVGAAAGLVVAEARRRGLVAVGVEPSRALVLSAPQVNGVELIQGTFPHPQLAGRTFDVISMVDVVEHVADPVQLLRDCGQSLSQGGILVVVTPDVGSATARLMGKRWWHLRFAHVGYFNTRSMRHATTAAGLVAVRSLRARWFFRVGYVAERLTRYLPIGRLNDLVRRVPVLRRAYDRVVPLNLGDSMVLFLQRGTDTR
jgi:2-polyprenyl-3-methyl-5-hydroxy-6-metoxy-1,4-benzoquinol methylase